jgi:TatD DNase family protein
MYTDTHCHLYLEQYAGDVDAVIRRAEEAKVKRFVIPGMDRETSQQAIALAEKYEGVFAAVGYHPTDIEKMTLDDFDKLSRLASHPKVVAIGEIGLDYYWVKDSRQRQKQRERLLPHLELADQLNKPIILHLREEHDAASGEASNDLFEILEAWQNHSITDKSKAGVFHSFNGNLRSAQRAIDMNFFIGITGPVTYKKNDSQRELVKQLPLDRILIETDSPFQAPHPHRGRRNEPANVTLVADKIAEIHRKTREAIAEATTANANRLFGWEANA